MAKEREINDEIERKDMYTEESERDRMDLRDDERDNDRESDD